MQKEEILVHIFQKKYLFDIIKKIFRHMIFPVYVTWFTYLNA